MNIANLPDNPYPGLRPFRADEEFLFFGRESQIDAMVDKLAATRFLAVVGTSGSGKSSLVNCGLVPALHRGLMADAGSAWRVATMRPGNQPLRALAEALAHPDALGQGDTGDTGFSPAEMMEALLRMSKLGIVDAFEQARLDARKNLLLVVDQFEELFRYRSLANSPAVAGEASPQSAAGDATAFVNLLLEVGAHHDLPVRIVLTMRSDFLGECAQFFGLPEAINNGQYLVPRMTRDERRRAIAGPTGVMGAQIDPALLTRLVNDVGDNPDQLSILQHALNRTWAFWKRTGGIGAIALEHYEAVGTMAQALNLHAEEAFAALPEGRPRALAEAMFRAITDTVTDGRGTRRPTRLDMLCEISGAGAGEMVAVIEVFREPARSFLMPPAGTVMHPDTPIDISHESLMRAWDRLRAWCNDEAQSAQIYRRLAQTALLHRDGNAGLLRQPDLQFALNWQQRQQPGAAWAARYGEGFEAMRDFIAQSQHAFDEETRAEAAIREMRARQERTRRTLAWGALAVLVAMVLGIAADRWKTYKDKQIESLEAKAIEDQTAAKAAEIAKRQADEAARAALRAQQQQELILADAAAKSPELRNAIAQAEQSLAKRALVYLQYADPGQAAMMARLQAQLKKAGYNAPGTEKVGTVPAQPELRYFRKDDLADAAKLAEQLKGWKLGSINPKFVPGHETQVKPRQFEIWLARPSEPEIAQLLAQINADSPDVRKPAAQQLLDRYQASPLAISQALASLRPESSSPLTPSGRINTLYFLTRTAPLAWDRALEADARELIARMRALPDVGAQSSVELERLKRLLDAVRAGSAEPPAAN